MRAFALAIALLAAACAPPLRQATAYPPTPDAKLARHICTGEMTKAAEFGAIGVLMTLPERQRRYDDCLLAHGWRED